MTQPTPRVPPIVPVILSGGSGSRLWPISRRAHPKQFLRLGGEATMLQATVGRLTGAAFGDTLVICAEEQRFQVAEQLQATPASARIILEPVGRNTAFPAAVAALVALASGSDPVLMITPADHYIADAPGFDRAIRAAAKAALDHDLIITLGIAPTGPETGYGYIHAPKPLGDDPGLRLVEKFVEKPDAALAQKYLTAGDFYWNSGVFIVRASVLQDEMSRHAPKTLEAAQAALDLARHDLDFLRLDADAVATAPDISLDYAVMEKTANAAMLAADIGWSDLGSWQALWQVGTQDKAGNVTVGAVFPQDSSGNYLHSDGPLIATIGVQDLAVIASGDAVLVAPRARAEEVKEMVATLRAAARPEAEEHRRVLRPWGSYESLAQGPRFQLKRIIVKPGAKLSLQSHRHRAEHWVVVSGEATVTIGEEVKTLIENQSTYVPLGAVHRLENAGTDDLILIEVQSGDYLGEDDIIRYDDVYARD